MGAINNIFGIKNKPIGELKTPERQSIEQTENYAIKHVLHLKELYIDEPIIYQRYRNTNSMTTLISTYGIGNLFFGARSGNITLNTANAKYNVGVGEDCFNTLTTGAENLAFGYSTGSQITTGIGNLYFGTSAGGPNPTGSYNTCIGANTASQAVDGDSYKLYIGDDGFGIPLIYGDASTGLLSVGGVHPVSRLTVMDGDLEVYDFNNSPGTSGIILTSPNGSRFRITISNAGVLVITAL
jgi:hypothetical protein